MPGVCTSGAGRADGRIYRVVVQSYRLTMDERLILRDVQECLTDAYARNRRVPPTVIRQNVRRKRVEIEEVESYGRSKRRRLLE